MQHTNNKQHDRMHKAASTERGIVFYSVYDPSKCVISKVNEYGKIYTCQTTTDSDEYRTIVSLDEVEEKLILQMQKMTIIFSILIILIGILSSILTRNINKVIASLIFCFFSSRSLVKIFLISYHLKNKHGKKNKTARLTGAKNQIINAYFDLKRIPTINEVKQYSIFIEDYDINFETFKILIFSIVAISISFVTINNILIPILICAIAIVLLLLLGKCTWNKVFQILFVSKPTDEDLELALAGLQEYDQMEKELKKEHDALREKVISTWHDINND